ncbi:MAG TPA: helix-turn-helix domain-containing protein [Steroidobacteraceae bacterium]|jgi:AcrR family transcriptional regulator|nr:helix-turn-helix domain-containing protein [Steroidobacteraceae bacterium]
MSSPAQDTQIDENARYKRVIRAAEELFKKVGFRAVTMELVAREANVAKATLYSYFKNKDELYVEVCARMARILRGSVEQALMKPDTALDERLADAVVAKHRPVFTLVRASPHAAELLTYTHSMAGEIFANLDVEMQDMLRKAIAEDPQLGRNAEQVARALYFGSAPLASRSESTAQMEQEVGAFARAYLAGARVLAKAK